MVELYLAEHEYQVQDILSYRGKCDGQWIALGPSAMHYLSKKGIHYTIPEDFCTHEEIENACVTQFEKLKQVCNKMDDFLLQRDPFLKEWGIRPFLFHLWQLGIIIDGLVSRVLQLKRILENFPESRVYVHLAQLQPWGGFGIGFSKHETLWGMLLGFPGWGNEVKILKDPSKLVQAEQLNKPINRFFKFLLQTKVKKYFNYHWIFVNILLSLRYGILLNSFKASFSTRTKNCILAIEGFYDWKYLFPYLTKNGTKLFFLKDKTLLNENIEFRKFRETSNYTEEIWKEFYNGFNFNTEEIDYLQIIKDRIMWIIECSPGVAMMVVEKLNKLLLNRDIRLAVNGVAPYFVQHVVKTFCLKKGIPVIGWQHGSNWYDKRITQRVDLEDLIINSIHFAYGDENKKAYESSDFKAICRVESVGSISLDKITSDAIGKRNQNQEKIRILYVITNYSNNGWYCGFSPPFSDRLYYKEQTIIIERFKKIILKMDKISLTIKLYHSEDRRDENPPWVSDLKNCKNIFLRRSPNFVEMLGMHDVVLIDSPTTTLLEAIATRLPVFVLTSIISPPSNDLEKLRKRAICENNAENLMDELEYYIKDGIYKADVNDREYLKLYGTFLDDGKSDIRAEAMLSKIFNHKRRYQCPGRML